MHLCGGPFEEFTAPANEEGVAGEDGALNWRFRGVFDVVADAVLGVAGGVEGGDGDVLADWEFGGVRGCFGDAAAVFAANYRGGGELFEHLCVAAGVVPVVVCVDDGR